MINLVGKLTKKAKHVGGRVKDRLYSLDSPVLRYFNQRSCKRKGFYDMDNTPALSGLSTVALNLVTLPFTRHVAFPFLAAFMISCLGDSPSKEVEYEDSKVEQRDIMPKRDFSSFIDSVFGLSSSFGDVDVIEEVKLGASEVEYQLLADNLERAGTINPREKINDILYDFSRGEVKVPDGDYFIKIGDNFYKSSNGVIPIPKGLVSEGQNVRFGSELMNESFIGNVVFVGDEKKVEDVQRVEIDFNPDKVDFGLDVNSDSLGVDSSGVGGLEGVIDSTNPGLSQKDINHNFHFAQKDIFSLFNDGMSAYGITDTYALTTNEVYDSIASSISEGSKYVGKKFNNNGKVRFNKRLAERLNLEFGHKTVNLPDIAYEMVHKQGKSFKEVADFLSEYTGKFEVRGAQMNISETQTRRWAGVFTDKYYEKHKEEIWRDFKGKEITVFYEKGSLKVTQIVR